MSAAPAPHSLAYSLIPTLVLSALIAFPFWRILRRAGLSSWWLLVLLVPAGFLILPWIIGLVPWKRPPGHVGEVFR